MATELHWDFIDRVWMSKSDFALCPLQDVLGLGSEARMNVPGQSGRFWAWRFTWDQLTADLEKRLRDITAKAER